MAPSTLTLVLDLCGVFVFALSGALAAVLRDDEARWAKAAREGLLPKQ